MFFSEFPTETQVSIEPPKWSKADLLCWRSPLLGDGSRSGGLCWRCLLLGDGSRRGGGCLRRCLRIMSRSRLRLNRWGHMAKRILAAITVAKRKQWGPKSTTAVHAIGQRSIKGDRRQRWLRDAAERLHEHLQCCEHVLVITRCRGCRRTPS